MDGRRVSSVVMATGVFLVLRFGRRQRFPDAIRQLVRQDKRQQTGSENHTHLPFSSRSRIQMEMCCVCTCGFVWGRVGDTEEEEMASGWRNKSEKSRQQEENGRRRESRHERQIHLAKPKEDLILWLSTDGMEELLAFSGQRFLGAD